MKNTKVELVPLVENEREQFILDFHIDEFWCEYFVPNHPMPNDDEHDPDEGPDEMFSFVKVMK